MFGAYWGSKIAPGLPRIVRRCSVDRPAVGARTVRLLADFPIDLVVKFFRLSSYYWDSLYSVSVDSVVWRRSLQNGLCPNAIVQMILTITLPQTLRPNHQLEAVSRWILKMLPTLIQTIILTSHGEHIPGWDSPWLNIPLGGLWINFLFLMTQTSSTFKLIYSLMFSRALLWTSNFISI